MPPRAVLGIVGKPFGLAGDVYVWLDPDLADALVAGVQCQVGARALEVAQVRRHRGRPVVRFAGVDDREAASALRGAELEVDRATIASDAVWTDELLGRDVVDESGALVGVVEGVLDGVAHDYLVVARTDGGELLVPAVDEVVGLSDPVTIHGPPGLVDPEQAIGATSSTLRPISEDSDRSAD